MYSNYGRFATKSGYRVRRRNTTYPGRNFHAKPKIPTSEVRHYNLRSCNVNNAVLPQAVYFRTGTDSTNNGEDVSRYVTMLPGTEGVPSMRTTGRPEEGDRTASRVFIRSLTLRFQVETSTYTRIRVLAFRAPNHNPTFTYVPNTGGTSSELFVLQRTAQSVASDDQTGLGILATLGDTDGPFILQRIGDNTFYWKTASAKLFDTPSNKDVCIYDQVIDNSHITRSDYIMNEKHYVPINQYFNYTSPINRTTFQDHHIQFCVMIDSNPILVEDLNILPKRLVTRVVGGFSVDISYQNHT